MSCSLPALCVLALGLSACGGETSLRTDALPLVQANCAGCHTRTNSQSPSAIVNGVYFEEPGDLTGLVGTAITAGDSANSFFVKVLKQEEKVGTSSSAMPPAPAPAMTAADISVVSAWIDEGAKDN